MESEISDNDNYVDLKPIWMDGSESYYPSRVLEEKLESIEKKYYELNYEHMELKNNYKSMETELKTMKEEKLKSESLFKTNISQLPNYRSKIVELKKIIKELTSGKKKLEIDMSNYISKSKGVKEQLKNAKSENFTLTINNTKLSQKIKDYEDGKLKKIKDTDKIKLENEKTKATINDLKIEILAYKSQIASLNEQLKVKDITSNVLILDNKIKDTNIKQCRVR
ncbi:girdin-like [Metopolophium dirhodum]|uniref:girdin-like n=1 Tax=Metopolophium dirhodum TaxID=44670 RepID=UPI00298FCB82|nr:girdin-like [Metopolophium dirhodum]